MDKQTPWVTLVLRLVETGQLATLSKLVLDTEARMQKLEKVVEAARGVMHREVIGGYGYEGYPELNSALHELDQP